MKQKEMPIVLRIPRSVEHLRQHYKNLLNNLRKYAHDYQTRKNRK